MSLLIKKIINRLIKKKLRISVVESCSGGMLSTTITSIPGSSKVFNLGLVAYSNKSKIDILKISKKILIKYGSVSEKVCSLMVKKIYKMGKSNIAVSTTGIAGPSGGSKKKPVGLVYVGIKRGNRVYVKKCLFKNKGRLYIQKATINKSLKLISSVIK